MGQSETFATSGSGGTDSHFLSAIGRAGTLSWEERVNLLLAIRNGTPSLWICVWTYRTARIRT